MYDPRINEVFEQLEKMQKIIDTHFIENSTGNFRELLHVTENTLHELSSIIGTSCEIIQSDLCKRCKYDECSIEGFPCNECMVANMINSTKIYMFEPKEET